MAIQIPAQCSVSLDFSALIIYGYGNLMDKGHHHPKKGKDLQMVLLGIGFFAFLVVAIGAVFYFLNQDNELMPDARPASPVEHKP